MIGVREILIFTAGCTAAFLAVVLIAYYYYCRWAKTERERRHVDVHVAEVMRDANKRR